MPKLWDNLADHPHRREIVLYSSSFLAYGMIISFIGPTIPFLAQQFNRPETDFNIMFLTRAIGFIIGSLSARKCQQCFTYNNIITAAGILTGLCFIAIYYATSVQGCQLAYFLASICCAHVEVYLNISILETFRDKEEEFWMMMFHGFFGIGALIIPIVIGLCGVVGAVVAGISIIIPCSLFQTLKTLQAPSNPTPQQKSSQNRFSELNFKQEFLLCFIMFLYIGEEVAFSGWISVYVVMQGLQSKKQAAFINALFWISFTMFKFPLAYLSGKPHEKYLLFSKIFMFALLISMILEYLEMIIFVTYFSSISVGVAISGLYAMLFTIPLGFQRKLSVSVSSNLMVFASFGQGILSTLLGEAITLQGTRAFFPSQLLIGIGMIISLNILVRDLSTTSNQDCNSEEISAQIELKQTLKPT